MTESSARASAYCPALQQGLQIRQLDAAGSEPQFLVTFGPRRWRVGSETYQVMRLCDGTRTPGQIAHALCETSGQQVPERFIHRVLDEVLIPNGLLVAGPDGKPLVAARAAARSHLSLKASFLSPERLRAVTQSLAPLFHPAAAAFVVAAALVVRLPALEDLAATAARGASFLTGGEGFLVVVALMMFGLLFHELGHVTACRRFGCDHGPIGVALYLVFPVFFADVRASWELPRRRRLAVDLGGLYFQTLISTLLYLGHSAWGWGPFLTAALGLDMMLIANLFPFFKWDGYWALSDLCGVPNLSQKARGLLFSLVTRRRPEGIDHLPLLTRWFLWMYGAAMLGITLLFVGLLLRYLPSALAEFPVAAQALLHGIARFNVDAAAFALLRLVKLLGIVGGISLLSWQWMRELLANKQRRQGVMR